MAFYQQCFKTPGIWWLCALALFYLPVQAQQSPNAYTFKHLTMQDGLASNHVSAIIQDRKGFIWIASTALQRYDGSNFITIADYNRVPGSIYYEDICLVEDRKGRIWAGTPDNIRMYDPESAREQVVPLDKGIASIEGLSCYNIIEDHEGQIWATTGAGLLRYDVHRHMFGRPAGLPDSIGMQMQSALAEDRYGNLWISGLKGIYIFSKNRNTIYSRHHNPHHLAALNIPASAKKILSDDRGQVWVAARNSRLYRYDTAGNTLHEYTFKHPEKANTIIRPYDIVPDMEHNIWTGTERAGIFKYDSTADQFTEQIMGNNKDELGLHYDYEVNCFLNDRDGHLWIGTDRGVNILSRHSQSFTRLDHRSNVNNHHTQLPRAEVTDIFQSRAGNVFIGYWGQGLAWLDRNFQLKKLFQYNEKDPQHSLGEEHGLVWSIAELPGGNIAIGQENGTISVLDPRKGTFTHHKPRELGDQTVLAILPDNDSTVWLGLYKLGLARWNPQTGQVRQYESILEQIHRTSSVMDIAPQGDSLLWLATSTGGVLVFDKKRETVRRHILFWQNGFDTIRNISCLYPVNDTIMLAGTDHGLFFYNDKTAGYEPLKINDTFFDEWVLSMEGNSNGIWLTTQYGFYRFDPIRRTLTSFVQNDDIIDNNRKVRRRIALLADGRMMTGASDHVMAFDPSRLVASPPPPDVTITGFRVLDNTIIIDSLLSDQKPIKLNYRQNFISIEFKSLQYHQERLRYFYKLDGVDERWVNAQGLLTARYTSLSPGSYTFQVRSVNTAGIFSQNMTTLHIVVEPAFWQTWWFRLLVVLFILSLVFGYFQARLYLVKREEKERANFQQQIAQLEMKALRAQMNPHFIFNSLNSIQTFMMKNETEQALSYLSRFARLIRNVLDHSQLNTIPIGKELEMLENYLELEKLRLADQFDYKVVTGPDVDVDYVEIPSMIIQPFLENAIWHGLLHKSNRGLLTLSFHIVDEQLRCTIEDNGIGRNAAAGIKQHNGQKHASKGLQITRDRLSLYNSRYGMNASFEIEDLKNENGEPVGTRVNLWLPLIED